MTREFVYERYEVQGDVIVEGAFRGQPWQAVAFHLLALQGCADHEHIEEGKSVYTFLLQRHDYSTYGIDYAFNRAVLTVTPDQVTIEFEK